jgi:hypothetical protein
MRSREKLFIATAAVEIGAGAFLLIAPALVIRFLLAVPKPSPEALVVGRVGGAGLLALGVDCWLSRRDRDSGSRDGLLYAMLTYNVGAFAVLAYAGSMQSMAGIVLWPAVVLHGVMAGWCVVNLPGNSTTLRRGPH